MITINPIRAFADNYIWAIGSQNSNQIVVVDPGDATPVLKYINEQALSLTAILITHHHYDHVGGIKKLTQHFPGIPVYGPKNEDITGITQFVSGQKKIQLNELIPQEDKFCSSKQTTQLNFNCSIEVIDVPGHTKGHIAYLAKSNNALFCGDTIFAGGCGRVFDGTIEQLYHSIHQLKQLPKETKIYCAHEYTVDNLGFAKWVEPENTDLLKRDDEAMTLAEKGIPTVPSTLEMECKTNPFLRTHITEVVQAAQKYAGHTLKTELEVFSAIREWKDSQYD